MNLATLEMTRPQARKAFLEYKAAVAERHDDETRAIMEVYRQISRGRTVLHLPDTFANGGFKMRTILGTKYNLPRLAIARADQREVRMIRSEHALTFAWGDWTYQRGWDRRVRRDRWRIRVPFDWDRATITHWDVEFTAMVPVVPAPLRPAKDLSGYHILWDAEWTTQGPRAVPRDPALLRRIGRGMYAVVAVWDLTPVERAVLSGRAVT